MSNTYTLTDGSLTFIIYPEKEENPATARADKKAVLVGINLLSLDKKPWDAKAIRALSEGLVKTTVKDSNGRYKRASKSVLIERLKEYCAAEKEILAAHADRVLSLISEAGYNEPLLLRLIAQYKNMELVDWTLTEQHKGKGFFLTDKGNELVTALTNTILSTSTNIYTQVTTLLPKVAGKIGTEFEGDVGKALQQELYSRFREKRKKINSEYTTQVAKWSANRKPVNFTVLHKFAKDVFANPDASYKELSVAIAFATGRRMAEIHCKHTQFSLVEGCDDRLLFKGQAKTKARGEIAPYEIITWLPANIVLDGYRRLVATGKCNYEIVDVNKKLGRAFSTDLPVKIRSVYQRAGISNYKELRDVYGAKIIHYFRDDETRTCNSYIAQYLGHHEYDVNTANTYQKIHLEY